MAAERQSIHSLQKIVVDRPCETSMWHHLNKLNMEQIKKVNHELLVEPILKILPKGKECIFAIDSTLDPYYGETTPQNKEYVIGSQMKKSTTTFYGYMTLYLIKGDRKLTLSMLPVRNDMPNQEYITHFLDIIAWTGVNVKALLLDREFYDVAVISLLKKNKIPFIMPVKNQSARMKEFLSEGRRSRWMKYTMKSQLKGSVEVDVLGVVKYYKGRGGKHALQRFGYIVNGIDWKPHKIAKTYEKRFAIESSYRMRNRVRPRTTTRNPTIRYVLALVSMLLKNIWVAIQWRYFIVPRRGPRRIDKEQFRFDYFRLIIWRSIISKLKFRHRILPLISNG